MNKRKQLIEDYEAVEAFWSEVNKRKELPETAILGLPTVLMKKIQIQLAMLNYDDAVSILNKATEMVDKGSIKTIDKLVNEVINNKSNID